MVHTHLQLLELIGAALEAIPHFDDVKALQVILAGEAAVARAFLFNSLHLQFDRHLGAIHQQHGHDGPHPAAADLRPQSVHLLQCIASQGQPQRFHLWDSNPFCRRESHPASAVIISVVDAAAP